MELTLEEKKIIRDCLEDSSANLLETQGRILEDVLESKRTQERMLLRKNLHNIIDLRIRTSQLLDYFTLDMSEEEVFIIDIGL